MLDAALSAKWSVREESFVPSMALCELLKVRGLSTAMRVMAYDECKLVNIAASLLRPAADQETPESALRPLRRE